jgi:hypothetical protein
MTVATSLALAAYPPWFRERYGDELSALSQDHGPSARATVDLAVGAVRAWVRPSFSGSSGEVRRLRLLASVSTVWVAWCVVVVGTMATLRLLEDPPAPGIDTRSTGWLLAGRLSTTAICVAALLIVVAGSKLGWRAMRSSSAARRMMIGPLLVLGLVVFGFVPIAIVAANTPAVDDTKHFSSSFVLGLLTWALLVAVTSIWWTIAIPRVLRVARPGPDALRLPTFAAVAVAVLLLAPAGLLAAVAISTGEAWGLPTTFVSTASTFVVVAAAAVGALSAGRGLRALNPEMARS